VVTDSLRRHKLARQEGYVECGIDVVRLVHDDKASPTSFIMLVAHAYGHHVRKKKTKGAREISDLISRRSGENGAR
jgi:hypothetical protein